MRETIAHPVRVELESRDAFWRKAVTVEWEHQFPDREPLDEGDDTLVIDASWLADFERVASKCFTRVTPSPADPGRRRLFRRLFNAGARR